MKAHFDNYASIQTLPEILSRVTDLIGSGNVKYSLAKQSAGLDSIELYTGLTTESIRSDNSGFSVLVKDHVLAFGVFASHATVSEASRSENAGREYAFVKITGGNGDKNLRNKQVQVTGKNSYGVSYAFTFKVEEAD